MIRQHPVLSQALVMALLGLLFCVWTALGNDVNFCITAGCTLYQDVTLGGISLWWIGSGVFALLGLLAVLGASGLGFLCSGLALLGDICLLSLLAITAPCVLCLVVAIFFALCYRAFRQAERSPAALGRPASHSGRSLLLTLWSILFIVNIGAVVHLQVGTWPILGEAEDASVHLYFSPSCPSCREAVQKLSGNVDVAFYPVAEGEADVHKTLDIGKGLDKGLSMAEALEQSQGSAISEGLWAKISPDKWLLRLRLLRNKAHVFMAGSSKVPFMEYRGLPSALAGQDKTRKEPVPPKSLPVPPVNPASPLDDKLPSELAPLTSGNCPGNKPCN